MALKNKKELLGIITEECAEVIQAISKINRFGLKGYHPDDPEKTTNIESLEEEVGDLIAVLEIFKSDEDVNTSHVIKSTSGKLDKLSEYSSVLDEPELKDKDFSDPKDISNQRRIKSFGDAIIKNLEDLIQKYEEFENSK